MKSAQTLAVAAFSIAALVLSGCTTSSNSDARLTNPKHPGPALGNAVGEGVGVVTGNVVGTVVGVGEGISNGVQAPFKNERRVVRTWQEVKTADGRTVKVPVEVEVDENGIPIQK